MYSKFEYWFEALFGTWCAGRAQCPGGEPLGNIQPRLFLPPGPSALDAKLTWENEDLPGVHSFQMSL